MPVANNMKDLHTSMLPIGSIIMWGLPLEQKPKNFVLCNGDEHIINGVKQKVPDLRGRFALGVGAGVDKNLKQLTFNFGDGVNKQNDIGEYEHKLSTSEMPSHTHTGKTSSDGEHDHKMNFIATPRGGGSGMVMVDHVTINNPKPEWYHHTHLNGNHAHSFNTDATGGNMAHNNMPPYFALHYLIKIAN